jgi:FixJ family two-component response regulator
MMALVAVVDDDASVLEAIGNLLASARYAAACFDSAESFLEVMAVRHFDCLITDIRLPGMSGVALQTHLGLVLPELPVILITGRNDPGVGAGAASNHHGLFRKPFDAGELLTAVRAAIEGDR